MFARRDPVTGHLRKMSLGTWVLPLLNVLARLKGLRATWADPFGFTAERRAERQAIDDYERLIADAMGLSLVHTNRTLTALSNIKLPSSSAPPLKVKELPDARAEPSTVRVWPAATVA